MKVLKGYISIKGKIESHPFTQTLVPVKNDKYRLYVNGPMLKGAGVKVGQTVNFIIEQDLTSRSEAYPMSEAFKEKLEAHNVLSAFKKLNPSRQTEIIRYLNYLKTEEARGRNIDKVIASLKKKPV